MAKAQLNQPNKEALKLLSRFSLPPNSLGYCGKGSATEKFKKCISSDACDGIDQEITHFIVLHPYIKTIAKINKLPLFDYKVAECFWLGNDLIKNAKVTDYETLMQNFIAQGVPESFVNELRKKQPKQFIPFHLFQVLHVGVGKSSGAVPFNLESINNCMIRWGKVTEIKGDFLTADFNGLKIDKGKYVFTRTHEELQYDPNILKGLKKGDTVSIHWKIANKILTKSEIKNLEFWSNKTLETLVY